jgi:hypothetical protein
MFYNIGPCPAIKKYHVFKMLSIIDKEIGKKMYPDGRKFLLYGRTQFFYFH